MISEWFWEDWGMVWGWFGQKHNHLPTSGLMFRTPPIHRPPKSPRTVPKPCPNHVQTTTKPFPSYAQTIPNRQQPSPKPSPKPIHTMAELLKCRCGDAHCCGSGVVLCRNARATRGAVAVLLRCCCRTAAALLQRWRGNAVALLWRCRGAAVARCWRMATNQVVTG